MIDPREFRTTLGRFATGVTVVTMREAGGTEDDTGDTGHTGDEAEDGGAGERVHGITVNAFLSVSLKPPLVGICIDKRANAHATLLESERYGVSVLRHDQEALSNHFAGYPTTSVEEPFEIYEGFPVIEGALAQLVCRVHEAVDAGDHTLFLGRVEALRHEDGTPLLYYEGKYAHVQALELSE